MLLRNQCQSLGDYEKTRDLPVTDNFFRIWSAVKKDIIRNENKKILDGTVSFCGI